MNSKGRNISLDIIKGIAIIAVVLYHLGVSKYGYLGVDLFFVISGYLVARSIIKNFVQDNFSYWSYLNKRISRLWPGLILISAVALGLGGVFMMSLHYKLACEAVVGTNFFVNNIIQYITSGDYWEAANEYKPLMHTWYVGILVQFYLIFPLIFIIAKKFSCQWKRCSFYITAVLSLLSIMVYVSPLMTDTQDFYLLPGRFFELGVGSMLALLLMQEDDNQTNVYFLSFVVLLCFALAVVFGWEINVIKLRLITVVFAAVLLVGFSNHFSISPALQKVLYPLSFLGVASYSLYLSHQVFFAFYRYVVNSLFTTYTYVWVLLASLVIGIAMYFLFEKPISNYISKKSTNMYKVNVACLVLAIAISTIAVYYYRQDGMVRDIPELGLYVGQNNQTPGQYNDAPRQLNIDFPNNGKKNIYVIGDSFGRDFVNILQAAGVDSVMNISYTMYVDKNTKPRIKKADYVFVATNLPFFSSYNYNEIYPDLFSRKFYRLGLKSFSRYYIGNIYKNRNKADYYTATGSENETTKEINAKEKPLFGDNFIDMMAPITGRDGKVRLFTDDKKLITQDGIHLTKAGAQLYAKRMNVWKYLK